MRVAKHRAWFLVALASGSLLWALPATAAAATGCERLDDARQRVDCTARAAARERAHAEVRDRLHDGTSKLAGTGTARGTGSTSAKHDTGNAAWDTAMDEAAGFHPGDLVEPRPIAFLIGLVWLGLLVRARTRVLWRRVTRPLRRGDGAA